MAFGKNSSHERNIRADNVLPVVCNSLKLRYNGTIARKRFQGMNRNIIEPVSDQSTDNQYADKHEHWRQPAVFLLKIHFCCFKV